MTKLQNSTNPTFGLEGQVWTSTGDNSIPNWGSYGLSPANYGAGNYYAATGLFSSQGLTSASGYPIGLNTLYALPIIIHETHAFTGISVYVKTGVAASTIVMGIYDVFFSGPLAGSNSGFIASATSSAYATYTFGMPIELIGGRQYYLAFWGSSASLEFGAQEAGSISISPNSGDIVGQHVGQAITGFTYGATLPNITGGGGTVIAIHNDDIWPLIWLIAST